MKINYLTILCASAVLAGCASNNSNQNALNVDSTASAATETKSESQVLDDGIDWEKPLYSLDEKGDTSDVYQYNAAGKLVKHSNYYEKHLMSGSKYYYDAAGNDTSCVSFFVDESQELPCGGFSKKFDSQNRVIAYEMDGESDSESATYRYEGNKKITESESSLSECIYKEVIETYFDADGNDTLVINKSQLVREASDTDPDYSVKPDIFTTRNTYVTINGKRVLKSSVTNKETKDGKKFVFSKEDNEYDQYGRLTKNICVSDQGNGDPATTDTYTYSYDGNCKTDSYGYKTYYAKK